MNKALEQFNSWLNVDTWSSSHPLDEERFYRAANAALKIRGDLHAENVSEYIIEHINKISNLDEKWLEQKADEYAYKFDIVSEFLSANSH